MHDGRQSQSTIVQSIDMTSTPVTIVFQSSSLQLTARLLEQSLRSGGVSFHVPVICALSLGHPVVSLVDKPLSVCEDRVPMRVDIPLWRTLSNC